MKTGSQVQPAGTASGLHAAAALCCTHQPVRVLLRELVADVASHGELELRVNEVGAAAL